MQNGEPPTYHEFQKYRYIQGHLTASVPSPFPLVTRLVFPVVGMEVSSLWDEIYEVQPIEESTLGNRTLKLHPFASLPGIIARRTKQFFAMLMAEPWNRRRIIVIRIKCCRLNHSSATFTSLGHPGTLFLTSLARGCRNSAR